MPVLKKPIRLPDVQFDWELENFGGSEAKVTDVALRARLRGGNIEDAGIRFNYGKTVFEGSFDVGLATDPPRGGLNVVAGDVDIGDLLRLRGLARNMEISARRLSIRTAGQGATVRDLLDWLTFDFEADEVRLVHSPPDSEEDVEVTVAQLSLRTHQGKPIRLEADARLLGRPVSLILESAWKADREDASMKEIPLHLGLFGETASLDLDAQIRLPFDTQQQSFALDFQAEDLAELPTPGVQLPSAGPIGLRGILTLEPDRYRVEDLSFRLGESQLKGHFDLQTAGEKSRLDADLRAPLMRIDDFQFEDWRKGRTAKAETPKAEPAVATLKEPEDRTRMLRHLLDSWEGAVSINLEDVRLGEETLGAGHLAATLKDGVLELAPLRMEGVAGDAELLFSCAESDEEVRLDVGLLAEDYDLGPLARGLDPKTELAGKLLLEAHVGGVAPDWTTLPAHLNGALVLGLFPDEFDATLLDFWGANVFAALMRRSDDPRRSRLNCLLGKFRLEEGRAQDAHLIVDTTRVRAEAKGWVDLGQERFGVELRPQSKRASFFSLLTPVGLQGSFEMPTVDVKALDIAGTAVGFVFSVITVPFERMFTEGLPRDGADVCEDTLQRWRSEAGAMSIASMAGGGASLLSIRGGPAEEVRAGGAASSGPTREESRQP
jgi:hypothetical protein